MFNPYVLTLLMELNSGLKNCRNFKRALEDFLHDYPFVEGMNENFPKETIFNAIKRAEALESTIEEFKSVIGENCHG